VTRSTRTETQIIEEQIDRDFPQLTIQDIPADFTEIEARESRHTKNSNKYSPQGLQQFVELTGWSSLHGPMKKNYSAFNCSSRGRVSLSQ